MSPDTRHPAPYARLLGLCLFGLTGITPSGHAIETCFTCHAAPNLSMRIADGQSTTPDAERLAMLGDAHATLGCADCHREAATVPHASDMATRSCSDCHDQLGGHALAASEAGTSGLPTCLSCHGSHAISRPSSPDSPMARENVISICSSCHPDMAVFSRSVHGSAPSLGDGTPAVVCTDCHGAHPGQEGGTLLSSVARPQLPATCGACHAEQLAEFDRSAHASAWAAGAAEAPVCSTCHGEHGIHAVADPEAEVAATAIPELCGGCHDEIALSERTGLEPVAYATYRESYHGITNFYGGSTVAHCASCHGAHAILPPTDPASTVHPDNLRQTCGECHPGITDLVAQGKMHLEVTPEGSPVVFWVAFGFKWLTIGTMAALVGHILLDLWKRLCLHVGPRKARREDGGEAV